MAPPFGTATLRACALLAACAWHGLALAESMDELRARAERGSTQAQILMGVKYYKGEGVVQDRVEAARWCRLAAEQGDPRGQYSLGALYDAGEGVVRDHVEAAKWYRMSAEQGDARGQYSIGDMYLAGDGVAQDYVEAHRWFSLSAVAGNQDAINARALVAEKMTSEQLAEAHRLAREWKPKTTGR